MFCTNTIKILGILKTSKLMGHKSTVTTEIYDHTSFEDIEQSQMVCSKTTIGLVLTEIGW